VFLMIDNYDSFTFNLVQLFGMQGVPMDVRRNDAIDVEGIRALAPRAVVISPGPCTPDQAGISLDVVRGLLGEIPLLGVCLGHQAIAQALGGRIRRAAQVVHGKTSRIHHDGRGLFEGVDNPFEATRYHSLVADPATLPVALQVSARSEDGEIMAVRHRAALCVGVQFHPESILTAAGASLMGSFIRQVERFWAGQWTSPAGPAGSAGSAGSAGAAGEGGEPRGARGTAPC
jgi:anthranilate synthase/aminodeoxychorismate synthase-like glutamine amidotransferase